MAKLPSDKNFSLRGETLQAAVDKDKAAGLIPFFVSLFRDISRVKLSVVQVRVQSESRSHKCKEIHKLSYN